MTVKISKTNPELAYFNDRLDEVQMSAYDRIRAKAQLARAEAIADAIAAVFAYAKRLLTPAKPGSFRRPTASAG
jgi:hypothetical protein